MEDSEDAALRMAGHEDSVNAPAPGALEAVRSFLSLHDHREGGSESVPPSAATLHGWLLSIGLIDPGTKVKPADLAWALEVQTALQTKVFENMGEPRDLDAIEILNEAARDTGLTMCFGCHEDPLHTEGTGVRGAIGLLLGTAFLAELDGSWHRLRQCQDPTCTTVFYDRSKNHSTKWCSMASCGNRNKVRKFRERHRQSA